MMGTTLDNRYRIDAGIGQGGRVPPIALRRSKGSVLMNEDLGRYYLIAFAMNDDLSRRFQSTGGADRMRFVRR